MAAMFERGGKFTRSKTKRKILVSELPTDTKSKYYNKLNPSRQRIPRKVDAVVRPIQTATLLFETFETRVLLDAVLPFNPVQTTSIANNTVLASDANPVTVQDADGTRVSISIVGNGHWQITQQALAPALTITGTDGNSKVAITTQGGNDRFLFSGIDVEGSAASLTGSVSVRANLRSRLMLACGMVSPLARGGLDAVCGVRLIGDFGATRAHDAGLPPVPLPHLR
jgi:hypothetical protein